MFNIGGPATSSAAALPWRKRRRAIPACLTVIDSIRLFNPNTDIMIPNRELSIELAPQM